MARFLHSRLSSGMYKVTWRQLLVLCVCVLTGLIYFSQGRRLSAVRLQPEEVRTTAEEEQHLFPVTTLWGAPLVWGDSEPSVWRRAEFSHHAFRVGLVVLAVGRYVHYLQGLLSSAELNFLPEVAVTYYILTDSPRQLDPPPSLGPMRKLRVIPVAEMPGLKRLALRRMDLLAKFIKEQVQWEVDYVYCMDVDQTFTGPVETEILGKLVATLHPGFYNKPRQTFPYETDKESAAFVFEGEGDYYYTSEFYGGLCKRVLALVQSCSQLILKDEERGIHARILEESYLNRYLINNRPTCVLSPEYSWWESQNSPNVPTQRILSLGRKCGPLSKLNEDTQAC
ncbi:globoside alpha-1,3-N-acetylgalactosaminyltransferase 1-like [Chanos chanos]|uniref:Globoside alpha-1,3-N-acetylgalactosaminyltransferase 1-like n=1 Tax=Chanos chanos TaxID=29144 RepID=A0A6J2UXS2_CHACN|nr:globoside alpha-1,3-N-acetylgalactosaminyltransferase 1-like [Chanos chanos]